MTRYGTSFASARVVGPAIADAVEIASAFEVVWPVGWQPATITKTATLTKLRAS